VLTTSRRRRQGIFSSSESGVCPKASRNFGDAFFLRLLTSPRSVTTSCPWATPTIRIEPKENFSKRIHTSTGVICAANRCQRRCTSEVLTSSLTRSKLPSTRHRVNDFTSNQLTTIMRSALGYVLAIVRIEDEERATGKLDKNLASVERATGRRLRRR
jgi:hypothetical protein